MHSLNSQHSSTIFSTSENSMTRNTSKQLPTLLQPINVMVLNVMPKLAQFHVTWLISTTLLMLLIFTIVLKLLPTTSTVNAQLNTKLNGVYGLRDTTTHSSAQLMNARQVTTHAMPMPSASIKPKDMTVSAK